MRSLVFTLLLICLCAQGFSSSVGAKPIFDGVTFKPQDSVLVSDYSGKTLFAWQVDKPLVPASLVKLATANLAINNWGLSQQFKTDFYRVGNTLWVKGYGDPFLVSEEIDLIASKLRKFELGGIEQISIDNSHFNITSVPGRSRVADPYNAPLSAVSANFNTAKLTRKGGAVASAEPQTPLTQTAAKLAGSLAKKTDRVNLVNSDNAQRNFAEILAFKLGLSSLDIQINQTLPVAAEHLYQHLNSHTLADVLRGTLEFSNNFMANQVFLKLGESYEESQNKNEALNFKLASTVAMAQLSHQFNWRGHSIVEGAGLSRDNRLSAEQINDLLISLEPNKTLFKKIKTNATSDVYAKTGTLDGVRSYAGFIQIAKKNYRFVFNFNRSLPYRYRDQMLERLLKDLQAY